MKFIAAKLIALTLAVFFSNATLAAPGNPIGGIIVKGGKNPGGQMLVLATTDAAGNFTIEFAEGGKYKLEFQGTSRKQFGERVKAGMQLDYAVKTRDEIAAESRQPASRARRHTPFHNKIEKAQTVVTVPPGGGVIRGTLLKRSD